MNPSIVQKLDRYTNEVVSFEPTIYNASGGPITDADVDNVIYCKGFNGLYYRRIVPGKMSVKWFGAVGDGVTDDTEALQRAFDSIASSFTGLTKLSLDFGYGYYTVSSTLLLNIPNISITLKGEGIRYSSIKAIAPMDSIIKLGFDDDSNSSRHYIRDLSFNLSGAISGGVVTTYALCGIDAVNIRYSDISLCEILNIPENGWGIKINHWVNNVYRNEITTATGMPAAGGILIVADSAVNNVSIDNNSIHNLEYGIRCDSNANLLNITRNTIDNCQGYGIYLSSGSRKCNIKDNYFERCGKNGFSINKGSGLTDIWYGAIIAHHNISSVAFLLDGLVISGNQFANCSLTTEGCITLSSVANVRIFDNQNFNNYTNDSFVHLKWLGCLYNTCKLLYIDVNPATSTQFGKVVNIDTDNNATSSSNIQVINRNQIPYVRNGLNELLSPLKIPASGSEWGQFYNVPSTNGKETFIIKAGVVNSRKIKNITLDSSSPYKGSYWRINYRTKGGGLYLQIKADGTVLYTFNQTSTDYVDVGRNGTIYIPSDASTVAFEFAVTSNSNDAYFTNFSLVPAFMSPDDNSGNDDPLLSGQDLYGSGTPEGNISTGQGVLFKRLDTGDIYIKTTVASLATGWQIISKIRSGTTAQRPAVTTIGYEYFDTEIGQPIWWNGTEWLTHLGAATTGVLGAVKKSASLTAGAPAPVTKLSQPAAAAYSQTDVQAMVDDITSLVTQLNATEARLADLISKQQAAGQQS